MQSLLTHWVDNNIEINDYDKAYIGASVDAEGSICITKTIDSYETKTGISKYNIYRLQIVITSSTDYEYIVEIQNILRKYGFFGGCISCCNKAKGNRKTAYELRIGVPYFMTFISIFRDYIILKREQLNTIEKMINKIISKDEAYNYCRYLNEKGCKAKNIGRPIQSTDFHFEVCFIQKYVATLIDTEGCLGLGYQDNSIKVCITKSVSEEYIKIICKMLDIIKFKYSVYNYKSNNNGKKAYIIYLSTYSFYRFYEFIKDHLILKRDRLECLYNIKNKNNVDYYVSELKKLNKRGLA